MVLVIGDENVNDSLIITNITDDTLQGLSGNDTLDGGPGNDRMEGGTGNDTYYVDSLGDVVYELPNEGIDEVFISSSFTNNEYTLPSNVEDLHMEFSASILNGYGNELDNLIVGNANVNLLHGYEGDDTIDGGFGGDWMRGWTGDDVYVIDDPSDVVIEYANEGTDTVEISSLYPGDYTLTSDYVENIDLKENFTGATTANSRRNTIRGNSLDNQIFALNGNDVVYGYEGDDEIHGGGNRDTLHGGDGDDELLGGNGADRLIGAGTINPLLDDSVSSLVAVPSIPGGEEDRDILDGGEDEATDVFVLGKSGANWYSDSSGFAIVRNFDYQFDLIELPGEIGDYSLEKGDVWWIGGDPNQDDGIIKKNGDVIAYVQDAEVREDDISFV